MAKNAASNGESSVFHATEDAKLDESVKNGLERGNGIVSGHSLKRGPDEDAMAGPPPKEPKHSDTPPDCTISPPDQRPDGPCTGLMTNGDQGKLKNGKSLPATLTAGASCNSSGQAILDPVAPAEQVGTLDELLDLQLAQQLEEDDDDRDVAAVLGDCSDKECSYDKNYMKRQALYSCMTCYKKTNEVAGICLACTYSCHDGHDFVELYTKRNFRCDCGNSKFSGLACKLTPNKDILNERNQYNQNFLNKYCVCSRPYPDPDPAREEMIQVQCTFCEDWFHLNHVLKDATDLESRLETPRSLVCVACRQKHPFTNYYIAEEGDLEGEFDATLKECQVDGCGLKFLQKKFEPLPAIEEAGWTPLDWYNSVCQCDSCKKLYAEENVEFLLDYDESVAVYEEKGLAKAELEKQTALARANEATSTSALQQIIEGMGRFQGIEFASSIAEMRANLDTFLADVSARGQVLRVEDITAFFAEETRKLKERQQQRRDPNGDVM